MHEGTRVYIEAISSTNKALHWRRYYLTHVGTHPKYKIPYWKIRKVMYLYLTFRCINIKKNIDYWIWTLYSLKRQRKKIRLLNLFVNLPGPVNCHPSVKQAINICQQVTYLPFGPSLIKITDVIFIASTFQIKISKFFEPNWTGHCLRRLTSHAMLFCF